MKTINGSDIIILDGGLGSTIEDTYKQDITRTPLWSAKPIQENPELIVDAHLAFLRAGAEIILTSTYQCSRETFEQSGYTPEEGAQIMQRSVKLADDARNAFLDERGKETVGSAGKSEVFVALSFGPFGSTLQPPQDFDGFYPPPFGPTAPSSSSPSPSPDSRDHGNTRLFSSDPTTNAGEETAAIEALAGFHLWRLRAVRSNDEAWDAVDYVAFETVPHLREVRAIKVAMARFFADLLPSTTTTTGGSNKPLKGWWISLVFPNGAESTQWGSKERHHQTQSLLGPECPPTEEGDILTVLLDETLGAVPTGFGINCTRIDSYPSILSSIISNSKFASSEAGPDGRPVPLTLVVYPNGGRLGDTFDGLTHRWVSDGKRRADGRNITWEEEVVEIVQKCRGDWKDIIVGGCCRVYPPQIKTLREKVKEAL